MGPAISSFNWLPAFWEGLFQGKQDIRILMLGLDAAGKSTILYKVKLGEVVTTIPTVGFNVESFDYKNVRFTTWDIGGQTKLRPLWRYYYNNTNGLIFVVDSSDRNRIEEAREELHKVLADDELRDAVVLVLANKQDFPNPITPAQMADDLKLHSLRNRDWFIQPSCALTGEGVFEGFDWLASTITKRLKSQKY